MIVKFNVSKTDLYIIVGLLALFTPIYLYKIYNFPVQMSTDEIVVMGTIKQLLSQNSPNIFGLSNYFHYPALVFLIFGWVGQVLGGLDLLHMRMTHALFGLVIILASYAFFSILFSDQRDKFFSAVLLSAAASVLLGSNHALILISRLAMRENSALLTEVLALLFLFLGFRNRSNFWLFLGGLILGLSFYVYLPGKMVTFIWLLFLGLMAFFKRTQYSLKYILKTLWISGFGSALIVIPLVISMVKSVSGTELAYIKEHLLIFPQALEEERKWVYAPTTTQALKINFLQGITTFNNKVQDNNYVYTNPGHGFTDPMTGLLLWIGVGSLLLRRSKKEADLLMLGGFFLTLLTLSTMFDKNPHYSRLLITLPFVSYLAIAGLRTICRLALNFDFKVLAALVFILVIFIQTVLNLGILAEYLIRGVINGDDVGGTTRYIEVRRSIPNYWFYLVTDSYFPYYSWGNITGLINRINTFTSPGQHSKLLSPRDFYEELNKPFTLFMSKPLWLKSQPAFIAKYPKFKIHNIKPDGSLVAIEVN